MREEILEESIKTLEKVRGLVNMDFAMGVYDLDCTVLYLYPENSSKIDFKVGDKFIDPSGCLNRAMETGNRVENKIPVYSKGVEMEGTILPIFDNGKVVGAMTAIYMPENAEDDLARYLAIRSVFYTMMIADLKTGDCQVVFNNFKADESEKFTSTLSNMVTSSIPNMHPDDIAGFISFIDRNNLEEGLKDKDRLTYDARFKSKRFEWYWVQFMVSKINNENLYGGSNKVLILTHDIHEQKSKQVKADEENIRLIENLKRANDELFERQNRDELTGLYNRAGLARMEVSLYEEAKNPGNDLFVYMIDMDGLKYINDEFGHDAGDQAISTLGRFIGRTAPCNWCAARLGGDEFIVLGAVPEYSDIPVNFIARIERLINKYNHLMNLPYDIEFSYGYYYGHVEDNMGIKTYVNTADRRMYAAKQKRREERLVADFEEDEELRAVGFEKEKILIADDDRFMRSILKSFFDDTYIILEAADGKEALRIILKEELSLVLLDNQMPKMDGLEVMKTLQGSKIIDTMPIIMITATQDVETEVKGYEYGVAEFIRKPFNEVVVRHGVNNILQLYKKQRELEKVLEDKANILQIQKRKLSEQAKKLDDSSKAKKS